MQEWIAWDCLHRAVTELTDSSHHIPNPSSYFTGKRPCSLSRVPPSTFSSSYLLHDHYDALTRRRRSRLITHVLLILVVLPAMPSLRRTVSESAGTARASPYPTSLSLSAMGALNAGVPIRPRRATSDTSGRRVLADIEWWRILDGQQDEVNDTGNENVQDRVAELQPGLVEAMQESSASTTTPSVPAVIDLADDASAAVASPDASQGASSLTTPFAALSISSSMPMTPPMTPRRPRNAFESPSSSVASTPESSPRTPAQHRETLFMDLHGFDSMCADDDKEFCTPLPPFLTVRGESALHSLAMIRSVSFSGFDAPRESDDERFGDVIFI